MFKPLIICTSCFIRYEQKPAEFFLLRSQSTGAKGICLIDIHTTRSPHCKHRSRPLVTIKRVLFKVLVDLTFQTLKLQFVHLYIVCVSNPLCLPPTLAVSHLEVTICVYCALLYFLIYPVQIRTPRKISVA